MKKNLTLVLAVILSLLCLTACGDNKESTTESSTTTEQTTAAATKTSSKADTSDSKWKVFPEELDYGEVLTVDETTDFKLDALKLKGNLHDYEDGEPEFSKTLKDLEHEFYLNEYIQFYYDTKFDVGGNPGQLRIIALPHRVLKSYENASYDALVSEAKNKGFFIEITSKSTDKSDKGFVGENYVNADNPAGNFDILLMNGKTICYCFVIRITAELVE